MKDRYSNFSDIAEQKEYQGKNFLNKHESDLFDEKANVATDVIRVSRVRMPNKGEKWKILSNNKVVYELVGTKFSKNEREFFRTANGISFILAQAKAGIKSINKFKTDLKKEMKKFGS